VHPFPSALDATAASAIALIAGSGARLALHLGLGMLCLQFAIGAANDFADSATDAQAKPAKPIPAGLLSREAVIVVFVIAALLGLALTASASAAALAVGVVGLADGLLYDLRLKGTALSWVPFAAGVGLLPVYAWLGATGTLPAFVLLVVTLAVAAGCALALANAFSDLERDRLSGVTSIATVLGPGRTIALNVSILAAVNIVAAATSMTVGTAPGLAAAEAGGMLLAWLGVFLAGVSSERWRHLVWEVQALGVLTLGAGWMAAMSSAGLLQP
jgi:4-hydroxybenzoate polyprenyltransferase